MKSDLFSNVKQNLKKIKSDTYNMSDKSCPKCAKPLLVCFRNHRQFLGCTDYPTCNYSEQLHQEGHIIKILDDLSCPECQQVLVLRNGRYGMFIGCNGFPECRYIASLKDSSTESDDEPRIKCPKCISDQKKGYLVAKKTRYGTTFYSCDNYPDCAFSMKGKPIAHPCPICGFPLMMQLKPDAEPVCASKKCTIKTRLNRSV